MKTCQHPPITAFIAFQGKLGACVWRCSRCGKEDVWRDGWQFFGSYECRVCSMAAIFVVLCSDECWQKFKPTDPKVALDIARCRAELSE